MNELTLIDTAIKYFQVLPLWGQITIIAIVGLLVAIPQIAPYTKNTWDDDIATALDGNGVLGMFKALLGRLFSIIAGNRGKAKNDPKIK